MKRASKIYTALVMIFLFAPIAILLLFSFNESKSLSVFSGFSLKWYQELFRDGDTLESVKNTLILACSASAIATVMGTAASVGINKLRNNKPLNTTTVNDLCRILNCPVERIMEYIPSEDDQAL